MSSNQKRRFQAALTALMLFSVVSGVVAGCGTAAPPDTATPTAAAASLYEGKKIVWVDSYNQGYEWSDQVEKGLRSGFEGTGVDLEILRMDTRSNPGAEYATSIAEQLHTQIETFQPDVLIASDDDAQKYLVVPYYKDTDLPVIFCGVNWDATEYGYPANNVTGMLEVDFVEQMVDNLSEYAEGDRIGYLSGDSSTDRKLADIYNERFFDGEMQVYLVSTFDEFKQTYLQAQDEVDILYFGNNAGIDGWDDAEAEAFIVENTKIPSGTRQSWMAPYVLMVLAKLGEEQGEWASAAALQILDGTPPAEIAVAENKRVQFILNLTLADRLDVVFTPSMLRNAQIYESEETGP